MLERSLADAHAGGLFAETATLLVRGYGPEVLGFLAAVLRDAEDGREVFALVCEDLWRGLPSFRRQSSFRTWLYMLARNAAHTFRNEPARRRRVALSECPEIWEAEQHVRTTTLVYLRTDVKDRVARLRDSLDPDDRMLLILRVDRAMAWNEIADVMGEAETEASDVPRPDAARRAATLRKRFERVKERLRAMATAAHPAA